MTDDPLRRRAEKAWEIVRDVTILGQTQDARKYVFDALTHTRQEALEETRDVIQRLQRCGCVAECVPCSAAIELAHRHLQAVP